MLADGTLEAIDAFVADQMRRGQIPGVAVSVSQDGRAVLERGYGHADLVTGTPMDETTGIVIGSTTKALTCVALLQLAARRLVDLDALVVRYLPEFRLADPEHSARITLRQAITHSAGLQPSLSTETSFLFNDDDAEDALARYVASLATKPPIGPPGGQWVYANDGYSLAGRIIEIVTGESYESYMHAHVFAPLGLQDTFFSHESRPDLTVATPYDFGADGAPFPSFFPHNRASAPGGSQLIMSARDAGRWLRAVLNGGHGESAALLDPAGFAELLRPQVPIPSGERGSDGASRRYALGWMVGPINGIAAISHGGSAITMGSQYLLAPEAQIAVAVLANSSSEANAIVAEGIANIALGRAPARTFPEVDRAYVPDRTLWPRLAGVYEPLRAQNTVPSALPIAYDGQVLRGVTYPADERRRAGDIFLRPVGDLNFVLSGRGRTGGRASFTIEGDTATADWMGVPLRRVP